MSLLFLPSPRTSLFLLFWLGEPPPCGEGDLGDALCHHRVLYVRPCTRHLWPRPALRRPRVTALPTGSEKPCNKEEERRTKWDFIQRFQHWHSVAAPSTSVIFFYFQILTCCSLLILLQKNGTCVHFLCLRGVFMFVIESCIFTSFSTAIVFYCTVIIASIRHAHICSSRPPRQPAWTEIAYRLKLFKEAGVEYCVFCLSWWVSILRRAVSTLKKRYKIRWITFWIKLITKSLLILAPSCDPGGVFFWEEPSPFSRGLLVLVCHHLL